MARDAAASRSAFASASWTAAAAAASLAAALASAFSAASTAAAARPFAAAALASAAAAFSTAACSRAAAFSAASCRSFANAFFFSPISPFLFLRSSSFFATAAARLASTSVIHAASRGLINYEDERRQREAVSAARRPQRRAHRMPSREPALSVCVYVGSVCVRARVRRGQRLGTGDD